jgi:aryl-alcohol dehydrogenase-like predicted oxidoreductase
VCRPSAIFWPMEFRYLGTSGMQVSEITYGNWLTHGGQVEDAAARACVHAALDAGITTFDTADGYADGAAEEVLGRALAGVRRASLEVMTKVYFPTGPKGHNDTGLSRKHILESIDGSLRRLGMDYVDVYQAHRFDVGTPLEETMQAFADVVRSGKALHIGVSEWTAEQLRAGQELAGGLGFRLVSNQPQYSALWRVIEGEVVPASEQLGISQLVFSPIAQGVLTGKYRPGQQPPTGSRATDQLGGGARFVSRFLRDDLLARVQRLAPIAAELGLTPAQLAVAWVLQNPNVAAAIIGASRPEQVAENVRASGVTIPLPLLERIDEVLGDAVERDPARTAQNAPKARLA